MPWSVLHCVLLTVALRASMVLDGSLDADRRAESMLKWDVLNGVRWCMCYRSMHAAPVCVQC